MLERVAKLGEMGEVVRVKDGYARNFLLKRNKALRATSDNRAKFESMKADLEVRNLQAKGEATKVAEKIDGRNVVVLRQASETGQLFGSVTVRDIIASFEADKVTISRSQVMLDAPIKTIGKHNIAIAVHPEVEVAVSVTVARSAVQLGARVMHYIFTGRSALGSLAIGPTSPEDIIRSPREYSIEWTYDDKLRLPDNLKKLLQNIVSGVYIDFELLSYAIFIVSIKNLLVAKENY